MSKNIYMVKNEPKAIEIPSNYHSNPSKSNLINKIDWGINQAEIGTPIMLNQDLPKKADDSDNQDKEEMIKGSLESRSLSVINEAKSASGNASSAVDL